MLDHLMDFGVWSIALMIVVPIQATVLAYVYQPRWKAFILLFPFPFTFATLALNRPVDATNATGLLLVLLFMHAVRELHYRFNINIVLAITISAICYGIIGSFLAPIIPSTDGIFWVTGTLSFLIGLFLFILFPHKAEPGHRSPLPIAFKWAIITGVIFILIIIKTYLRGFMTVFPMIGVVIAYEARYSLWTICRQIPVLLMAMIPMMMVMRLIQEKLGLGKALILGWIVLLIIIVPVSFLQWKKTGNNALQSET